MITINLLPFEIRPVKRTPLPYMLSVAAFFLMVAACGVVYLADIANINSAQQLYNAHVSELNTLLPVVEEYNALSDKKAQLAKQVQTIDEIASDRIIWSRQLFNLSRLAVENSWYSGITVAPKPFNEPRKVLNETTGELEYQNVVVTKQVLTLSGYVIPGPEGSSDMSPLTRRFEEDEEFSSSFQLDLPSFSDTRVNDKAVREFSLEYVYGGSEKEL